MRSLTRYLSVWLVAGAAVVSSSRAAEPVPGNSLWRTDYVQAQADAKRLDRPLLLHFYADWCGPCQKMERETFRSPELARLLQDGFVAVKVNSDKYPQIVQKYHVEALPTDIILTPDGKVLSKSEGYRNKGEYVGTVARADAMYAPQRKANLAKAQPAPTPAAPAPTQPATVGERTAPERNVASLSRQTPSSDAGPMVTQTPGEKLPPFPQDDVEVAASEPSKRLFDATPTSQSQTVAPDLKYTDSPDMPVIGLDGFCPVTLKLTRTWKPGHKNYAVEYKGQVFYCATAEQRERFSSDPARYAPRLMGCDPVTLNETDLAVPGSTKFGAYFEGELYLFESAESRNRFRAEPTRYNRTKHVLNPDDIKRRRV